MPIYEYRCASCGHEQEFLQKLSDAPLTECPQCHEAALTKLLSAAAFQLKGSGWYATDFKQKNGGKAADKATDGARADQADTPAEKKTEKKTETPTGGACGAGGCPAC